MAHRLPPEEKYQHFIRKYPRTVYWLRLGLHPKAARELVKLGIRRVKDVAGKSREELSAIPGVGAATIRKLEKLLGSEVPSRRGNWEERGLSRYLAHALGRAGIDSIEKLGGLTREQFLSVSGLGPDSLRVCERVLGRRLDSPVRFWQQQGLRPVAAHRLGTLGIRTVEELADRSEPDLRSLGLHDPDVAVCRRIVQDFQRRGKS
jgi:helix-hairpin-helix protein